MAFPIVKLIENKLVNWVWKPSSMIFSQNLKHPVLSKHPLENGDALNFCKVEGSNLVWHPHFWIFFSLSIMYIKRMKPWVFRCSGYVYHEFGKKKDENIVSLKDQMKGND